MAIIDKRKAGKNQSADNRQRFIKRYKGHIKKAVDNLGNEGSITEGTGNRKIKIPAKDLQEPGFELDQTTGRSDRVLPGNKTLQRGDTIKKPQKGEGESGPQGSDSGEGNDEFTFVLTKAEFLEIFFSEMALPNFIKESLKDTKKYKLKRSGYTKDGTPARMDLMKTFQQALARRIATKASKPEGEAPRWLDDVDLRYRHFVKKPQPVTHAVVFFLMDVSMSMGENEKMIAKKFFMLLYMFLEREYEKIELRFIRHTTEADEVDEKEFFYSVESGGTMVSTGLKLINDIIDKEITLSETNVYVAQASDGDNFAHDDADCLVELEKVLSKVQYFAYIQVEDSGRAAWKTRMAAKDLYVNYSKVGGKILNIQKVGSAEDVYPVLKKLFAKE